MTTAVEANRNQVLALIAALRAGESPIPDAEFDEIILAQYEGAIRDDVRREMSLAVTGEAQATLLSIMRSNNSTRGEMVAAAAALLGVSASHGPRLWVYEGDPSAGLPGA